MSKSSNSKRKSSKSKKEKRRSKSPQNLPEVSVIHEAAHEANQEVAVDEPPAEQSENNLDQMIEEEMLESVPEIGEPFGDDQVDNILSNKMIVHNHNF